MRVIYLFIMKIILDQHSKGTHYFHRIVGLVVLSMSVLNAALALC